MRAQLRRKGRNALSLSRDGAWLKEITPNPGRLLADMAQKGYAHRIQAGHYLVETGEGGPQKLPLVDALEPLASILLDKIGVPYYLSWHTALFHYGLLEQQASVIYCAVPKAKAAARFARFEVRFVKVSRESFFGIEPAMDFDQPVIMARPEKALLDSLCRPELAVSYATVIGAFESAAQRRLLDPERLVAYAIKMGSAALVRRVGFLMDRYGLGGSDALLMHMGPRRRLEAFRPGDARDAGTADSKWCLNVPERILATAEQLK